MRLFRYLALALVLLAACSLLSWWWVLHTDAGARFAWRQAEAALGGIVTAGSIEGDLGSGVRFSDLRVAAGDVDVTAGSVGFALDVDVLPFSLRISGAVIEPLNVAIAAGDGADTGPLEIGRILDSLRLPFPLLIDDLEVRDATVSGSAMSRDLSVQRVAFSGQWFNRIRIDRLQVETDTHSLTADGNLQLATPHRLRLDATATTQQAFVGEDDRIDLTLSADGPVEELAFESAGLVALTGYSPLDVDLQGVVNIGRLQLERFRIAGDDLRASGSATLAWSERFAAAADIMLDHANVHAFASSWPAAHPATGRLSVVLEPGVVRIDDSTLSVVGTGAEVNGSVNIDTSTKVVAGAVDWNALQWPIASATPDVSSSSGSVNVSGTLESWRVDGRVNVEAAGVEEGFFVIDGSGDRDHASVKISEARVLGGRLSGEASYNWSGRRPWSAALDLSDISTATLARDWPGVISGNVSAKGRAKDRFLQAELRDVSGRLRERDFIANGGFAVDGKDIIARELSLRHGRSEFVLDGNLYGPKGLAFTATVANLGELLPAASGAFTASGRVSLNEADPYLRIDGESPVMTYGELHVTNLRIADDGAGILGVRVAADDVSLGGELISAPRLSIQVAEDRQSITINGAYQDFSLALSLAGRADRWDAPSRWDGELEDFSIAGAGGTTATLDQSARIVVSSDRVLMERACVTDAGGAGACLRLDWLFAERIELGASVTRVPLNTVNSLRDVGFDFDQLVNGTVQWRQIFGERATGSGNISVSKGTVVSRDRPGFVVQTDTGTVAFNILEGQLFAATIDFPMPGTGKVSGQFSVLDVTNTADSGVEGELQFELSDIAILSILSPLVDTATGRLRGNVTIAGSVQAPLVSGSLNLDAGSLSYLPLGLHLEDINLDSTLTDSRRLDARGSFRAGEGRGEIVSSAEYGVAATGLEIAVRGKNLTVIDVPDVQARADVDLRVGLMDEALTLGGRIFIPHARVQPENLPSSRASVSDDVVIVAGTLPDEKQAQPASDRKMSGSVEVALGNDVVIDLDVARASLTGSATFDWNGPAIPVANGRYGLAGEIEAFGQVLEIVEGGIRFPNVPANNPYLRIRAEREIYGNSQVKTAGVLVDGTLARPTIDAYTYPATTEQRALTLLVTGSDFNFEQGVGAVDFGTYVAPRLFVSYGVGLFGRDNVISARYDLARGFGIKATSGQTESGIDLIYRLER